MGFPANHPAIERGLIAADPPTRTARGPLGNNDNNYGGVRMKGSDFGSPPPDNVGEWAYSMSEDGDGDGIWSNSADDREQAVAELKAHCEEDDVPFHGYVGELIEVDVSGPDAERMVDDVREFTYDANGDVGAKWPAATKDDIAALQERLDKAFGEWLTERKLWPTWAMLGPIEEVTDDANQVGVLP